MSAGRLQALAVEISRECRLARQAQVNAIINPKTKWWGKRLGSAAWVQRAQVHIDRAAELHRQMSGEANKARASFQARVAPWMLECFGEMIAGDKEERSHRFLEEALELVQACGTTADEAHQLVDYVFGRDVGEKPQEVGGVQVTLAALCLAQRLDMHECGEAELARVWTKVEKIRAKQAAKPKFGPLPGPSDPTAS